MAEELDVESRQNYGKDPELAESGQGDEREGGQEPTDRRQDQELGVSIAFNSVHFVDFSFSIFICCRDTKEEMENEFKDLENCSR